MQSLVRRCISFQPKMFSSMHVKTISTRNLTLPLTSLPLVPPYRPAPHLVLSRRPAHSNPTSSVTRDFEKCLKDEIKYEHSVLTDLPTIKGFKTSINGLEATFSRDLKNELVSVSVHAHEKIEPEIFSDPETIDGKSADECDEDATPDEFAYLPLIYIDITKPDGTKLKIDCSFNPEADSLQTILETGLIINSARIVPPGTKDVGECYALEGMHFDDKIYDHMVEYLECKGLGIDFLNELIQFYQAFEHQLYLKQFLLKLSNFLKT